MAERQTRANRHGGMEEDSPNYNALQMEMSDQEEETEVIKPGGGDGEPSSDDDGRLFRTCERVGSISLLAIAMVVEFVAMPQHTRTIPFQAIDVQDATIHVRNSMYDEALNDSTVGTAVLILVGVVLPLIAQLVLSTCCFRRRPFDRHNTLVSYLVVFSMTLLVIDFLKLYCGYLRPHFYDVCQPDANYELCTNRDEGEVREGRKSFPSGHAGLSLSGLGSLSMYLHHRFGVGGVSSEKANTQVHRIARLWSFVAIFPILLALFMGGSRIHDNYHHPADVVGGFAIGGVAAYFCHHVWFLQ